MLRPPKLAVQQFYLTSKNLAREVLLDVYLPSGLGTKSSKKKYPLLLFNDGQDLPKMAFAEILEKLILAKKIPTMAVVGIHASERRLREYGVSAQADYKSRGDLALQYAEFIKKELLPTLEREFPLSPKVEERAIAGFSLGGLSAFDIAWANPQIFGTVAVFSGSFWWRSQAINPTDPDAHRIMHEVVQKTALVDLQQKFWFQCGTEDETEDRNGNGVIDVIDDTLDLVRCLRERGIPEKNIRYLEMEGGRHEPATWGKAMPDFLRWAFA